MSTPRVHYIGLDTPVSPGARGLISKEICAQSAAVQKRSALFCHPSLIPVQSYLADLWYLQHIGTPEVPGGVVNFSSPPTTLLRHKEQPAPSHPPPSLLRWLRHPSAVRRPSFWHSFSASEFRPPIIIQLNKTAGCGGPLPARRFPGARGGAAYFLGSYG